MEIYLNKTPGLRNDLLLIIPRQEVETALFHIANRARLMSLPGLVRHSAQQDATERQQVGECKIPAAAHLQAMTLDGQTLLDESGRARRRLIAIGSRNVGNNHGFVAWQRAETPRLFHVRGEPFNYPAYSCLVSQLDGRLALRRLRFEQEQVWEDARAVTAEINWCVYANQVLRAGRVVNVEEIIEECYDIRHVLAFDRQQAAGRQLEAEIYADYPARFRANALRAWRESGVPRNRFLHNCLGLSEEHVFILQREGTIEELGHWLKEAGARDGLILDNGGSVFCWAWWLSPQGGFLFTAPDFRPPSSALIAFVLNGTAHSSLPGGSVSYAVV